MEGFKISGSKNANGRNNPRGQNFPVQISIFLKEEIGYNIPLSQADKLRIADRTLNIDFHDHIRGIMFEKIEKITLGELVLWENHFEKIEFTFPIKTLKIMTKIAEKDPILFPKLVEIMGLDSVYKKNRWFGYYQRVGEECGYWSLQDVINWVITEKNNSEKVEK